MDEFLKRLQGTEPFPAWNTQPTEEEEEEKVITEPTMATEEPMVEEPTMVEKEEVVTEQPAQEQEVFTTPFGGEQFTIEQPTQQPTMATEEGVVTEEVVTEPTQRPFGTSTAAERQAERSQRALARLLPQSDEINFYKDYLGKTSNILTMSNLEPDIEDTQKMAWLGKLATYEATGNEEILKPGTVDENEYAQKGKNLVQAFANQRRAESKLEDITEGDVDESIITQTPKMFAKGFSQSVNRSLAGLAGIAGDITGSSDAMRNTEKFFRENADTWDTILQTSDEFNNSTLGQLSAGFGQLASTLALAAVPGGAAAKLATGAKAASQFAGQGLATIMGVGAEYNDAYESAIDSGMSEEEARAAAQKYAPAGVVDVLSDLTVARFLKIPGLGKKTLGQLTGDLKALPSKFAEKTFQDLSKKLAITLPGSVLLEGGTEGLQRIYQNEILNKPWYEGAWDEAKIGGIIGGTVNVVAKGVEKVAGSGVEPQVAARLEGAINKLGEAGATQTQEALTKAIDPTATATTPLTPEQEQRTEQALKVRPTYQPGTFEEVVQRDTETGISPATTERLNKAITNGANLFVGNKQVKIETNGDILDNDGNAVNVDEINTNGIRVAPAPLNSGVVTQFEQEISQAKTSEDLGKLILEAEVASVEDPRWQPLAQKAKVENLHRTVTRDLAPELTPVGYFDTRKTKSKFVENGIFNVTKARKALETSVNDNIKSGGLAAYYVKEDDGSLTKYDVKGATDEAIIVDGIGKVKSADIVKGKAGYIRSVAGIESQTDGTPQFTPAVKSAANLIDSLNSGRLGTGEPAISRINKVARDNGIDITPQMTFQDTIEKIKEIAQPVFDSRVAAPIAPTPTGEVAPTPTAEVTSVTPTPEAVEVVPFEEISEGHKAFSEGLDTLIKGGSLTPERKSIIQEVFRDSDPEFLKNLSDIRTRRNLATAGLAATQRRDGEYIRSWITLRKGNVENFTKAESDFWKSPSSEPMVILLHEFGHVGYDAVLNADERALVDKVFNDLVKSGKINDYSKQGLARGKQIEYFAKNPQEFIAQSFADYVISNKVPTSSLKAVLDKLYRKFRDGISRVIGRATTKEARLLEPILEKMRVGRAPTKVTTKTYRAEPIVTELAGEEVDVTTTEDAAGPAIPTTSDQVKATAAKILGKDPGNAYVQNLSASKWPAPLRALVRLFGRGSRTPITQQGNELRSAKLTEITGLAQVYINNFNSAIQEEFKVEYNNLPKEIKDVVDRASIRESDPISEAQERRIKEAGETERDNVLLNLIRNKITPAQIVEFENSPNPDKWLRDNLGDDLASIRAKAYTAGSRIENQERDRISKENIENTKRNREESLNQLPDKVRNAIQKMVTNIEQLTSKQIKDGIIPPKSKLILQGREGDRKTNIDIAKAYLVNDWQLYADKFKTTPEEMQKLMAWAEKQYIDSQVNKYQQAVYEQTGKIVSPKEARTAAYAKMKSEGINLENTIRAFMDAAVASPQKAFQDVLVKGLGLDQGLAETSFAQAIRDALVEVNSATTTYAQITGNIAEAIANYDMFTLIRENAGPDGEGWLVDAKEASELGPEALRNYVPVSEIETRIPGFKNAFSGLWIPREFLNEMENTYKVFNAQIGGVVQGMLALNNLSMAAQTSLNPIRGPIRNFFGNPFIFLASGKYQFNELAKSLETTWGLFRQRGDGYVLQEMEDAYKYGMVEDNPNTGLIREQMKIARDNAAQKNLLSKGLNTDIVKKGSELASRWYTAPDNIWRYTMWKLNQKTLQEAYPQRLPERLGGFEAGTAEYNDGIKKEAANWTKNEIPSFSRMNALGRAFRKPGVAAVAAPFIGFTSEILRIAHANLFLAYDNIRNGTKENNAALKADGYRRLAGTAIAYSSAGAIAAVFKSLFDIDDEEEEAARATLPPWDKNASLIWWRDSKTGKLKYFNTSFLNPLSIITDPFNVGRASLREDENGGPKAYAKAFGNSMMKLFEGYIDPQIATKAVFQAVTNSEEGRQIYNPEASSTEKLLDISSHIGNAINPGIFKQSIALGKALGGVENREGVVAERGPALLNFFLGRSSEVNPDVAFKYKAFEMNQRLRDSARILTSQIKRKGGISDLEIQDAYTQANDAYSNVLSEAINLYQGQLKLGTDSKILDELMTAANLSKDVQRQIKNGIIKPYGLSKATSRVIAPERVKILKELQEAQPVRLAGDKKVLNAPVGYPINKPTEEADSEV